MFFKFIILELLAVAALAFFAPAAAQIAKADALVNIVIDGDLSDWPEDMTRYPVRTKAIVEGSGLQHADLDQSADFSPEFRVGYDPQKNLVYVAVEVRDDHLVIGDNYDLTDAVEIYINREAHWPMQYALVPGAGGSYNRGSPNPNLYQGNIYQTRAQAAYSRQGDITIYEWAVEAFEDYPDRPLALTPGRKLLFDVVAIDKDPGEQGYGFVAWGPSSSEKYGGANRVGRLELTGAVVPVTAQAWWGQIDIRNLVADIADALIAIFIILSIGTAIAIVISVVRRPSKGAVPPEVLEGMVTRLEAIERRLTDTQDVMIDLSEKYDRLEGKYQNSQED